MKPDLFVIQVQDLFMCGDIKIESSPLHRVVLTRRLTLTLTSFNRCRRCRFVFPSYDWLGLVGSSSIATIQ